MKEEITRRGFLRGVGATAAAAAIPVGAAATTVSRPVGWMSTKLPEIEVQIGEVRFMVPVHYEYIEVGGKTVLRECTDQHALVKAALERRRGGH